MPVAQEVKRILIIILVANLIVAFMKIALGNIINSNSITADGFHSLSDGLSNVVGIIGIYLASRPKDENHPYGHKRYENITGLFIGGVLMIFAINIARQAIATFYNPVIPNITGFSIYTLIFTLIVNIFVAYYEYKKGRELSSDILIADSLHTRSDVFITCGVLITLGAIYFGAPPIIDSILSLIVAGCIFFAAIKIIRRTSDVLLDCAAVDGDFIEKITLDFDEVMGVHSIRSRSSGSYIYVDMHILIDPIMSIEDAHSLVHDIETKIKKEIQPNMQVLIHPEPFEKKI